MPRIITILFLTSIFVITVHSENVLKCYMCTSLSDNGCDSNMTTKLPPRECTGTEILGWQQRIKQHQILDSVRQFFEVHETVQHYQGALQNMACAKVIFNIAEQDVIVRMCQIAKTEYIDPCKTMEDKLNSYDSVKMKQCALCLKDACNSTMFLSSEIFCIFLSFFCTFIAFYLSA